MTDKHTPTPWLVVPGRGFIYALDENGVNRFQAFIDGAHCPESELVANARHIVKCVNYHDRLAEALRECQEYFYGEPHRGKFAYLDNLADKVDFLLEQLDTKKESE